MSRRHAARLLASAVGLALSMALVGPASAAGSLNWTDESGDATGLDPLPPPADGAVTSTPRPQDEGLDLLAASVVSDGQTVVFTARTATDAVPPGASGTTIRFLFSYEGVGYQLIAQRTAADFSAAITSGVFLRSREARSPELACRECTVKYDPKTASVTVRAQVASLANGIREHSPESKKFGAGATLTNLAVLAQRNAAPLARDVDVGRTVTADVAAAEGLALAV